MKSNISHWSEQPIPQGPPRTRLPKLDKETIKRIRALKRQDMEREQRRIKQMKERYLVKSVSYLARQES